MSDGHDAKFLDPRKKKINREQRQLAGWPWELSPQSMVCARFPDWDFWAGRRGDDFKNVTSGSRANQRTWVVDGMPCTDLCTVFSDPTVQA